MIEVIGGRSAKIIEDGLREGFTELSDLDVTVFELGIHQNQSSEQSREFFNRITEVANQGGKVMLASFAANILAKNNWFQAILALPNVEFILLPKSLKDMAVEIKDFADGPGKARNELAIELANKTMPQDKIRNLKHDIGNIQRGVALDRKESWINMAKELYGDLSFEELAAKVEEATETDLPSMFEARSLDGVFIDIEGTLVQGNELNKDLVAKMREMEPTKPVTIWTDGNIDSYNWLRNKGIMNPILPKQIFRGAVVAEAFDDLVQGEFEKQTGIKAEIFHNVEPQEALREGDPNTRR